MKIFQNAIVYTGDGFADALALEGVRMAPLAEHTASLAETLEGQQVW